MRQILVDEARHKNTIKRGGKFDRIELTDARIELSDACLATNERDIDLIALDEALEELAAAHPRHAELVNLRFFAGLSVDQAAEALGIVVSTAGRDWAYAKAWLRARMVGYERP